MANFWSAIFAWMWQWTDFLALAIPLAWAVFMLERVATLKRDISGLHASLEYIEHRTICEACYARAEHEYKATLQAQKATTLKREADLAYIRRASSMRRVTPMQFGPLIADALQRRDPKAFDCIARAGQLNTWIQAREREAVARLEEIMAKEPRNLDGQVANPNAIRAAEEVIVANLSEFLTNTNSELPSHINDQIDGND